MHRLQGLIDRGPTATADLGPPIHTAFGWVHRAAHILGTAGIEAATARRQMGRLLGAMTGHRETVGELATAVDHFVKVRVCPIRGGLARTMGYANPTIPQ